MPARSDLFIQGSSELYPTLFNNGLIDRLFVLTFPIVLGGGKKLFAQGLSPFAMKLIDYKVSTTGVILSTYEPAGNIPLGTFELSETWKPEIARQKRMKADC